MSTCCDGIDLDNVQDMSQRQMKIMNTLTFSCFEVSQSIHACVQCVQAFAKLCCQHEYNVLYMSSPDTLMTIAKPGLSYDSGDSEFVW